MLEVQHAAYAIEARLIGYPQLPPAHETLASLQGCGEEVWLCEEDGELLGAATTSSWSAEPGPDRWKPPGGGFQSWPRQDGQGYVP